MTRHSRRRYGNNPKGQWEAPRWTSHQGAAGGCMPVRCEKGYTWGQVPARIRRGDCVGGPARGRQAGRQEGPWNGKSLAGRAGSWRLATGGCTPQQIYFLV